ncbi:MAG: hypothetical protein WCP96_22250 [Methylococcaceae bacterium]
MNAPTHKKIPSFIDLVGFDVKKLTAHWLNDKQVYTLDGSDEDIEQLKSAVENAQQLLHSGIESISGLLLTIKMHCPKEVSNDDEIGAMWLMGELSRALSVVNESSYRLGMAISGDVE